MIVVTGATGHLGRLVVEGLLAKVPAERIVPAVQSPEKAGDLAAGGGRGGSGLPHAGPGPVPIAVRHPRLTHSW